jgi:NAD(P)-dependent dehydrogenase (short-subunit alcohol dehydrogenase family)
MKKTILITGASSGLGLLTSLEFALEGHHVIATMRDLNKKDKLLQAAKQHGIEDRIDMVHMDISDEAQVFNGIPDVLSKHQKIDVLINNAGISMNGFVEELPMQNWRNIFDTNLFGAIACTKAVLPQMRERRTGFILNVSSIAGRIGEPMWGPYAASKFALEGFSESLRQEVEAFGIKVALIEPTPFKSNAEVSRQENYYLKENSPYAEQAEAINQNFEQLIQHAMETDEIVDVMKQVLSEEKPNFRYLIGKIMGKKVKEIINHSVKID